MFTRPYLLAFFLCASLHTAFAAQITVGSCRPNQSSYNTISAAVAAARPGDTIDICPGTYPEQLNIGKSLSIQGISFPNQSGVTITAPATGLQQLPAGSASYPQIYVDHAGGPVTVSNLAIDGAGANILYDTISFDTTSACQLGFIEDFAGIYYRNTPGYVQGVSISGHFVTSATPDNYGPQQYPDCGSGIEFDNRSEEAMVDNSVINGFGLLGISSTGPLTASHNALMTQSGPYQIGIQATSRGEIRNNAISGATFVQSTGIQGGGDVEDNLIQGFSLGIVQAGLVKHNTLMNNSTGISDPGQAQDNLITASTQQYMDPACAGGACGPNPNYLPTVGVDMTCQESNQVRGNGMVGVGVGVANIRKNGNVVSSNLYAGIGVTTTSCAK